MLLLPAGLRHGALRTFANGWCTIARLHAATTSSCTFCGLPAADSIRHAIAECEALATAVDVVFPTVIDPMRRLMICGISPIDAERVAFVAVFPRTAAQLVVKPSPARLNEFAVAISRASFQQRDASASA